MNKIFKKIGIILLVALFAALFMEFSFRVMYSIKHRNPRYMTYGFRDVFKFNVRHFRGYDKIEEPAKNEDNIYMGLRTAPFSLKKPKGEYRIVAIGESSVYGLYTPYEESWPYLLEKKLNERLKDNHYRVINAGIPGQTTYEVANMLRYEALDWEPDIVIIYTLYNHINIDVFSLYNKEKINRFMNVIKAVFYEKSLLVTHVVDYIVAHSGAMTDRVDKYGILMEEMLGACRERGVDAIYVKQLAQPKSFDNCYTTKCLRNENRSGEGVYYVFMEEIDEVAGKYDTKVVDFSASSPACEGKLNLLLRDVVHLTAYGKDLLSDVLADEIVKIREGK